MSLILLALTFTYCLSTLRGQEVQLSPAEKIVIDAHAPAHPFPHFWERMFGSGRATLSLRASYRREMRQVQRATGFEYVRFHGIFDDDTGIYSVGAQGNPVYNYSYVDQIYDGLIKNHVRPFVELSFMPKQLASTNQTQAFWYRPYISPPKDWSRWGDMVQHFAQHLVARYGIDEVAQWYFEVWNEPNIDFWAGNPKQQTYYHLYDVTARALKSVSPRLRVGGPATAQAAWVTSFIQHCVHQHVPADFVSTHVYGNDSAQDVFGTNEKISREEMVYRAVRKVHDEVKASPLPNLPIIFSEYSASYSNDPRVTDSAFMGPWLANTIRQCDGLVDIMSYWTFSDVFEEQGVVKMPFYGGFGLIAEGGIHKASFNDFRLLHKLGTERLAANSNSVIVTRRRDGALAIAVWNYAPPGQGGTAKTFNLFLKGLSGGHHAIGWIVDARHGSPLATWKSMGKPDFPTRAQLKILREAGQMPAPRIWPVMPGDPTLSLKLAPHALALIEVVQ
ncbi:MAG: GH39 family glycosyl hydrolase [Terriglobia bacterium]